MLKDLSGQLMLISAFLLAMMVVAITMMLNNVIYSSNMAYIGFMDQSRYDDLSYKQATIKEAIYAEAVDRSNYNDYMEDYAKSLNNITSMRGRYVDLATSTTSSGPFSSTKTRTELTISGKNSNISYVLYTGYNNSQPSPVPSPSPTTAFNVTISANKTSMYNDGKDTVRLVITVTDANTGLPASSFLLNILTDRGESPLAYIFDDGGTSNNPPYLVTDLSGTKIVYYRDNNSTIGTAHIYATAQLNNSSTKYSSNVIEISVASPPPVTTCNHNISISGTPQIDNIPGKGDDYRITVTFNIGPFSNLNVYPMVNNSTIQYDNNPSYDNATRQLTLNVYTHGNDNFKLVIIMDITGFCTEDKINISRTATLTINGDKKSISATLT